jgi:hypothetical protein
MDQPTTHDLARRLERLERENRHWKALTLVAIAAVASVVLMGQARSPRQIDVESLRVFDPQGALVVSLGHSFITNDDGSRSTVGGVLTIYSPGGRGQVNLHFLDGPSLDLADGRGNFAELQVFPGGPELHFKAGTTHTYWPTP